MYFYTCNDNSNFIKDKQHSHRVTSFTVSLLLQLTIVNLHSRIWCHLVFLKDISNIWVDLFDLESWLVGVATLS